MSDRPEQNDELFKAAIQKWGPASQLNMGVEECAEFIQAMMKVHRAGGNSGSAERVNLIEECADVIVTMQSIRLILGADEVDAEVTRKMCRLLDLIRA